MEVRAPHRHNRRMPTSKRATGGRRPPGHKPGVGAPDFIEPQLATLVKEAPAGDDWWHEMKFDGYRILAQVSSAGVQLLSRRNHDWTGAFPTVASAVADLGLRDALLDGEVAVVDAQGRTSFQALQNTVAAAQPPAGLCYFLFDALRMNGEDLMPLPLAERKARLRGVLDKAKAKRSATLLRYSDHIEGHGAAFFREACRGGLEGIVSKRKDQPYRPGRGATWVKTKCVQRQEMVIGGYTDPEGQRAGLGALLVGTFAPDGRLLYAGKVGTGFSQQAARELRARLEEVAQRECPFTPKPPAGWIGRQAHWVKPELVAEVSFSEWTDDGRLRHPSFQGLRADKAARDVVRETAKAVAPEASAPESPAPAVRAKPSRKTVRAGAAGKAADNAVAGQKISHPDRVVYPATGTTKLDVARYFAEIAPWMVPHVAGRPLTLVRCPEGLAGECFFMKHSNVWAPKTLRQVDVQEKTKVGRYLIADDAAGLVALAQMGVLEVHTWNSTMAALEEPDRIVMDLDPGPEVGWADVVQTALLVRQALATLGLESLVKTTGGVGLHVVVPLRPQRSWQECFAFSEKLAEVIVREHPTRYTTAIPKAGREKKILLDYLRNNRTNTSVAAYSPRARPGATVSTPLAWDELEPRLRPGDFTLATVLERCRRWSPGEDPWTRDQTKLAKRQLIKAAAMRAIGADTAS